MEFVEPSMKMTKAELLDTAFSLGLEVSNSMTKQEILDKINEVL